MLRKFTFRNFKPTALIKDACFLSFERIWNRSPANSSVRATLVQEADGAYHTIIEIQGTCGRFFAEASDRVALVSIELAERSMQKILGGWHAAEA